MLKVKILTVVLVMVLSFQANAQSLNKLKGRNNVFWAKGKNMIGLSIDGFLTEDTFFEYYGFKYGKFLCNRFSAGGEIGRGWFGNWERTTHLGANARYYYISREHFSGFTEMRYLFGFRKYENERTLSEWSGRTNNFSINLGVAFNGFYKKRIGVEFFAGYAFNTLHISNHPALGEYNWNKSDIGYGFQINYHFK